MSSDSNEAKDKKEEMVDEEYGVIKPDGSINWKCPCLGGMADGPCGEEFRKAFSCFHYSEADPKGSDCIENFRDMQDCFQNYPEIYGRYTEDGDDDDGGDDGGDDDDVDNGGGGNNDSGDDKNLV